MRERDNYFADIEREAAERARAPVGYSGGALSQGMLISVVGHYGFAVRYVQDLPQSARSVTDLRNRRIYLQQEPVGTHSPRAVVLQALGHFLLGHKVPRGLRRLPAAAGRGELLRRRGADARDRGRAVPPARPSSDRDLAIEDLRDVFSVSYEMAAHRFTNLATHHLGLPCHFIRTDASGMIYKAYENDGRGVPGRPTGRDRGTADVPQWAARQVFAAADRYSPYCQYSDTPSGSYFCIAHVDPRAGRGFAVTFGVPFEHRGGSAAAR